MKGCGVPRSSYVYFALADYCFLPSPVERKCAADGKFNIFTRDERGTGFDRSRLPGFAARDA